MIAPRTYRFACGCEWPLVDDTPGLEPLVRIDTDVARRDCPATWELIGRGLTRGVFQLESPLGRQWSKRLKPETIEHLTALTAALRPGCLQARDDEGVSMTERFVRRRHGEPLPEMHPEALKLLGDTYGVMLLQEQLIFLAMKLAGFDKMKADHLRKCVSGKTMFVSDSRGWVSIDTLLETGYEEEKFLVMDEAGRTAWKGIEKIWHTGFKSVHRVSAGGGFSVMATCKHQFLTTRGWVARSRLKPGDRGVVARRVEFTGNDVIPLDKALVLTGLITEGHFVKGRCPSFTAFDPFMMNVFTTAAASSLYGDGLWIDQNDRVAHLTITAAREINKILPFGLSASKAFPEFMLGATKETMRKFLSFALAAEGGVTVCSGTFDWSSKSRKLIEQVILMLLRFGVRCRLFKNRVEGYPDDYWRITVKERRCQQIIFDELTCLWPESKIDSLRQVLKAKTCKESKADTVPTDMTRRFADQYPGCMSYESGTAYTAPLSRARFLRIAKKSGDQYWIDVASGPQAYEELSVPERRESVTDTYDFTVEGGDTPYIVANGMVIHNCVGKKDMGKLMEMKEAFITGCKEAAIITAEFAETLWGWIQASGRYLFGRAHARCYAESAYDTAYLKAHVPLAFLTAKLRYAKEKPRPKDEINELAMEARSLGIPILPPDLRRPKASFSTDRRSVRFGLGDVMGVGPAAVKKVRKTFPPGSLDSATWEDALLSLQSIAAGTANALVESGALDWLGKPRRLLLDWNYKLRALTGKNELPWLLEHRKEFPSLLAALEALSLPGAGCHDSRRRAAVASLAALAKTPPSPLVDTPGWVVRAEERMLGIALTASPLDECDVSEANCTLREFLSGRAGHMVFAARLRAVREFTCRNGSSKGMRMAFLTLEDDTARVEDVVAFADVYALTKPVLNEGALLVVRGSRDKKKGSGTLVVEAAWAAARPAKDDSPGGFI